MSLHHWLIYLLSWSWCNHLHVRTNAEEFIPECHPMMLTPNHPPFLWFIYLSLFLSILCAFSYLEDEYHARKSAEEKDSDKTLKDEKGLIKESPEGTESPENSQKNTCDVTNANVDTEGSSEEKEGSAEHSLSLNLQVPPSPVIVAGGVGADEDKGQDKDKEKKSNMTALTSIKASAISMPHFKCNVRAVQYCAALYFPSPASWLPRHYWLPCIVTSWIWSVYSKVPQQVNGYDCGVYVQLFAKYVMDEWPTSTQADHKNRWLLIPLESKASYCNIASYFYLHIYSLILSLLSLDSALILMLTSFPKRMWQMSERAFGLPLKGTCCTALRCAMKRCAVLCCAAPHHSYLPMHPAETDMFWRQCAIFFISFFI